MKATLKLARIDHSLIKEPTWIVFARNNGVYKASTTFKWGNEEKSTSPGEYYIEHITEEREWRYVYPDQVDRVKYDYFQKVIAEINENGNTYQVDVRFSEWQLIVTCLLGRQVEVEYLGMFSHKVPTVTVSYIYSPEVIKLEEPLIRIRDIAQPHWTHHEHWDKVCEIAKGALISQKELNLLK
jgi:hypothetical protein